MELSASTTMVIIQFIYCGLCGKKGTVKVNSIYYVTTAL